MEAVERSWPTAWVVGRYESVREWHLLYRKCYTYCQRHSGWLFSGAGALEECLDSVVPSRVAYILSLSTIERYSQGKGADGNGQDWPVGPNGLWS